MNHQGGIGCVAFFVCGMAVAFVAVFRQSEFMLVGLGAAILGVAFVAVALAVSRWKERLEIDEAAEINNRAYEIRSVFGEAAQRKYLDDVSVPARPGAATNERRLAPGQSRQTMLAKEREIRGKYRPVQLWRR